MHIYRMTRYITALAEKGPGPVRRPPSSVHPLSVCFALLPPTNTVDQGYNLPHRTRTRSTQALAALATNDSADQHENDPAVRSSMLKSCWQDSYSNYYDTGGAHSKRPVEEVVILRLGELVLDHALQNAKREGQRRQYSKDGGGQESTSAQHLVGEHPIHILSVLVAHRLARKIEQCADLVPINLNIHGSVGAMNAVLL